MDYVSEVLTALIKHGWSLTTIGIALTALLRVNGVRKIILRRLPKRFRHEDRLERIERKIDAIATHTGVPDWKNSGASKTLIIGPTNSERSLPSLRTVISQVNRLRRRETMKLNKAILLPIASSIAGFIKESTGYEITQDYLDLGVNFILFVVIPIVGYFMHPRKKGDPIDDIVFASAESTK